MTFDPKSLKKLAKQLRAAGIKSYKCAEFEMLLADETPVIHKRTKRKVTTDSVDSISSDGWDNLTEDEKLYWSVSGEQPTTEDTQ